ncbi:MAG TPA: RsiV family protein [Candidatus Limiplasma sp.]|nr:RsiV family protein [Candidatus Limiplasma sp.]HPS82522.1 RsiV family protein [Candidatus Limiplasma sp.]
MRIFLPLAKRLSLIVTAALLVLPPAAFAETATPNATVNQVTVQDVVTQIGENTIRYPQLEGMSDAAVQQKINDTIVEKGKITQRMVTLTTLSETGTGLTVDYEAFVGGGVFSTVISASGIMENGRKGQEYSTLTVSLATGEPLTLADLFTDPDQAIADMEAILENTYQDELSSYLENSALTPLPTNSFTLNADGITFYYPANQFAMLSGYSGTAQFNYSELTDDWLQGGDKLPATLNALPAAMSDAEIKAAIAKTVTAGTLPHIHTALGDSIPDLIDRYRLLRTPDEYPGGRYFQFEAPAFRQVLVLSDALGNGWEHSTVQGIMSFRTDLYGIQTGKTTRKRWNKILGQPESSVEFDENLAFDYGLPVGTADYYSFGERQLLLYADADGVLYAIRVT